ncbi:hypothetical protein LJC17_00790 [Acholeplasma sp. OttesenSCG-928-E16]|nr:hypothetical protein [Acholeplasma sp. OttesenSCG-928-E16]
MGIESSILDDAYDILNKKETDLSKTLNKLNQEKLEVAKKEAILSDQIKHYESLLFKHLEDKKLFDENKEKLLKNIEQKEKDKWENLKEELKDLISNLRNKEIISLNEAASLKNKINQNHKTDDNPTDDEELLVGDSVYIRPYQKYGKIVSIRKNDLEVSFGDFKMRFKRDDLKKTNEIKEEAKNKSSKKRSDADLVSKDAKLEVDLRGYRFDDVKDALEKAIDKAIVSNLNMLYVIHGFGTLAVKKSRDGGHKKITVC